MVFFKKTGYIYNKSSAAYEKSICVHDHVSGVGYYVEGRKMRPFEVWRRESCSKGAAFFFVSRSS